jgi:lipopolysaccharide export system permease protein
MTMVAPPRPFTVINRYVARQFLSLLLPILAGFVLLYIIIDLFDRLDILLRHDATLSAATRYFLFKIPLMLTQITPPAVITAALLTYGLLGRRNEIIAFRSSGVSLWQTAAPVLVLSLAISAAALAWNETVVPYSSRKFQYVNNIEIRKRALRGVLSERAIWFHGADGFYHIDYVDRDRQAVFDVTIYRLDNHFHLRSVVHVPRADWRDGQWHTTDAVEYPMTDGAGIGAPLPVDGLHIAETLDDFLEVQREPEELSFTALRDRIDDLARKGIDASHYLVDLYLKLALPFASCVLAVVAVPIAGRLRRHPSIAAIVGIGTAVGFGYWVVLGLSTSLGQTGALPPLVAAWAANGLYLLLGTALFLSSD